jgi:predicted deacetylase
VASNRTPFERVRTLVSVHDLMPETLPAVQRTLERLDRHGIAPVTLLVVPGAGWDDAGMAALHRLQEAGYRLAGHGWRHRVERISRPYHRLHSLLISRRVAEHLALDAEGILALTRRCHDWFRVQGLAEPQLYVPPAWAMGSISRERLAADGLFPLYELFGGVFDARARRWHPTPMLGYEADVAGRVPVIRAWNALNRSRARGRGLLRIGIHPFDIGLRLEADLARDLARLRTVIDYPELGQSPGCQMRASSSRRPGSSASSDSSTGSSRHEGASSSWR